jgi:hypothetical protein
MPKKDIKEEKKTEGTSLRRSARLKNMNYEKEKKSKEDKFKNVSPINKVEDKKGLASADSNDLKGSFYLFCKENRNKVMKDNPTKKTEEITEMLRIKWENITKKEKDKYDKMAKNEEEK